MTWQETWEAASTFRAGYGLPFGSFIRHTAKASVAAESLEANILDVVAIALFASLLCLCIIVGHLLEEHRWTNESVTAILFGLITGAVVLIWQRGESGHILEFNEELFFIYLLPPIIFNAGFQVKKKQFFRNFPAIMAYGVVGVFISFAVISAGCNNLFQLFGLEPLDFKDYLSLGAIFSATDSVCTLQVLSQDEQPLLYSLVFGEGVVNDATSVVLFRTIQKSKLENISLLSLGSTFGDFLYLFSASTALGVAVGLLSAFIIKALYIGWHSTDREVALMVLMAYLSYVLSELAELSGILTVFFCGIVMSHYTWHNVTESSRVTTKHAFATMSFIAETFIFIYVGMDTMKAEKWENANFKEAGMLFSMLLFLTLLGRAAFVFPLSALINMRRKGAQIISIRQQVVIWWAGLMRGAVSIALVFNAFPTDATQKDSTVVSTTVAFVLFSTVVFGLLTRPLIDWLLPACDELTREDSLISELGSPKEATQPLLPNGHSEGPEKPFSRLRNQLVAIDTTGLTPVKAAVVKSKSGIGALLKAGERDVHDLWRYFDDTFMRPYFGGRGFVPYTPASPTVVEDEPPPEDDVVDDLPEDGAGSGSRGAGGGQPRMLRRDSMSPSRRSSFRYEIATNVEEGLAESDPAWPEATHKYEHRVRRGDNSSFREGSGGKEDRRAAVRDWP